MDDLESTPILPEGRDGVSISTEAQILHRKLGFWRRIAWLLLGVVAVVMVVIWQRDLVYRNSCRQALDYYAKRARAAQLQTVPIELLDTQWRSLPARGVQLPAGHYELLENNWLLTPADGEKIPLAVCDQSHLAVFSRGRYVLYRTSEGDHIEWLTEDQAAPIAQKAMSDHLRP